MSENIIKLEDRTIIFNGGDPLKNCPSSFEEFHRWIDEANGFPFEEIEENKCSIPVWNSDCGFKLDFDGPIISVSSRFYPPKSHYGPTWDGSVDILFLGDKISSKYFDEKTFKELVEKVRTYVDSYIGEIRNLIIKIEGAKHRDS